MTGLRQLFNPLLAAAEAEATNARFRLAEIERRAEDAESEGEGEERVDERREHRTQDTGRREEKGQKGQHAQ